MLKPSELTVTQMCVYMFHRTLGYGLNQDVQVPPFRSFSWLLKPRQPNYRC